jgi:hypothetical protein
MLDREAVRRVARRLRVATAVPLPLATRLYGGTDKWLHGYTDHYATHLRPYRWRRNRILEIGVGGYESLSPGGSLRLWRDYLPRSQVVGLDINDKEVDLGPSVRFVRGDQTDVDALSRAVAALDGSPTIVIDDGSHLVEHAATSFEFLFPLLSAGGLYVIEDLHTSYLPDWGGSFPATGGTAVGLVRSLVDDVQTRDRVFTRKPHWTRPPVSIADVASVHVYPGIVFVAKATGST